MTKVTLGPNVAEPFVIDRCPMSKRVIVAPPTDPITGNPVSAYKLDAKAARDLGEALIRSADALENDR